MYPRIFTIRIGLSVTICASLLGPTGLSPFVSEQNQGSGRTARPRPGRPAGTLPDLDDVRNESHLQREALPPIPSVVRSPKNSGRPWDGRRVGDPDERRVLGQNASRRTNRTERGSAGSTVAFNPKRVTERRHQTRRAHAHPTTPPPLPDTQFVQNFFTYTLTRNPYDNETTYWYDQLRVAYAQSQSSLKLAAIELGRTLFESAAYAARNRNAHGYVYDLYKTYLMREPDAGGWATWEALVTTHGREYVRRGFEEAGEFATVIANIVPSGTPTADAASLISARVDPRNQPGTGMLPREASWSVSLLSLPGRNGLDLGLALSYSSLVWTRSGPYLYFDEDNGFPSPGFRLGFPTVQRKVFNAQTAKNAYLMLTAAGRRVELRQVDSNIYDAADSSYLRLTEAGATLRVHSTDGTRLSFTEANGEYRCVEIRDRNGNYITVNYNSLGHITNIADTLGRVIVFNYDGNENLLSITQSWNGQPSHQWVSLGWGTRNLQASFSDGSLRGIVGPSNGAALPVLTQVGLNDTSHFTFDYTNSLQLSVVKNYFGTLERNATTFIYDTSAGDAPRLLESRLSARNWSGYNNVPAQVVTSYSVDGNACVLTVPDGTVYKEYYGTGWQKGLTTQSEVWSGGVKQKWTTTTWTQDNPVVGYEVNPRVTETNVYDASGNRRRVTIDYGPQFGLPHVVHEFAANGVNEIRQTVTEYNLSQAYLDRRIIGLVSEVQLKNGSTWLSKTTYSYDDPARLQSLPAAATQHDSSCNTSFTARGNVTAVSRWDVNDVNNAAKKLTSYTNYYTTGRPSSSIDPAGHQNSITYADSFSDNVNRNTFAYPTTVTDADGNSSYVQYNFDLGATTRTESPAPEGQEHGAIQTMTYNNLGQLERITTTNNGAYKRFWYGAEFTASYTAVNNVADELYTVEVTNGVGQVIGALSNHPGSTGGYRLVNTVYNLMGRAWLQSNPTEVTSSWAPSGDDAAGIYYTQQTYDWQGRPLITTNPDGTTREASYSGCGCAGGAVVTLTDEGTLDGGVAKRRQQKIYSDVLGRTVKTETLNWQGGTVYSSTVNTYNARDQVEHIHQYAGPEGSNTFQVTMVAYDGYGRLQSKHTPEQTAGKATVWTYDEDDTITSITDARGASQTFAYNNRHLTTSVTYAAGNSGVVVPGQVTYTYDAVGNRLSMTDDTGTINYEYNNISQLKSETRKFSGPLSGTGYALSYQYNLAGQLKKLTEHTNTTINYNYDNIGQITGVTGENNLVAGVATYASTMRYRAWGAMRAISFGNGTSQQVNFNARLFPTSASLTNVVIGLNQSATMSWTYNYYGDGRPRYASDATDDRFDRLLEYDHGGRLKEAYSGREARGLAATTPHPNSPYRQSFQYDAFDNQLQKSGRLWRTTQSGPSPCIPRQSNDGCDAEGNLLTYQNDIHTYDAAGKQLRFVDWRSPVGGSPNHPEFQPRVEISQTYDGDGQVAKRLETRRSEELINGGPNTNISETVTTTYYLYSSVLGGEKVVELGPNGEKTFGYVYVNGSRLAKQYMQSSASTVEWHHTNPGVTSWITTGAERVPDRQELDPDHAEVGTEDPWSGVVQGEQPTYGKIKEDEPLYIEGGDPFDYVSGYTLDGLPMTRSQLNRILGRLGPGRLLLFDVYRVDEELRNHPSEWTRPEYYAGTFGIVAPNGIPQNRRARRMSREEIISFMDEISQFLTDNPECEAGLNKLLSELKNITHFDAGNIRDIIDRFKKDGIVYDGGSGGSSETGTAMGGIPAIGFSAHPSKTGSILTMMGEMIHWAGKIGHLGPEYSNEFFFPDYEGVGFTSHFPDAAIATAGNNLGYVMTVEQYRKVYHKFSERYKDQFGSDYASSILAHGAIDNACLKEKNLLLPKYATP